MGCAARTCGFAGAGGCGRQPATSSNARTMSNSLVNAWLSRRRSLHNKADLISRDYPKDQCGCPARSAPRHGACKSSIPGGGFLLPNGQLPVGTYEMTGVAVGNPFEVILMLRIGFPEIARRRDFRHHLAGPQPRRIDIGDGLERHALLLLARVKDRGAIARPNVVALPV